MTGQSIFLTVVIPAFNEESNLEQALSVNCSALDQMNIEHEMIIVNDCSVDQTRDVANRLAQEKGVRAFHHEKNQGIGGAFRTGLNEAKGDYVMLVPADNPLSADEFRSFIRHMGEADVIAGQRLERTGYSFILRFMSWFYNRVLIGGLFGISLSDVNWIPAYRREIFTKHGLGITYRGPFFFVEVLVKAKRLGLSIVSTPCPMKRRIHGRPTISRISVIYRMFKDVVVFAFKR